ncbi:PEP-CTERM sorting domain-containing protein [Roseateles sp.]|uniref:PEP-CTERM sorting domain-containing protein n=1 Tax=Roseateles sp. TaxID=1971397 RepID=UPI003BA8A743
MNSARPAMPALATALAMALSSFGAHADTPVVFGFEELSVPFYSAGTIPDGYAGATWTGWILRRRDELQYTGLNGGSGAILALAVADSPEISFASPVLFDGLFAFNPTAKLAFNLFLHGEYVGTSGTRPAGGGFLASNYSGQVDRIVFNGSAYAFSIDDMSATLAAPVPEPGAWALMLAGVAGLGLLRRRSRRA